MTINVALLTSEILVLGCDSTASTGDYYIDPFSIGLEMDSTGKPVTDVDGKYSVKFAAKDMEHIVTDAWGGVTKMFQLNGGGCHVAAVTAGLAALNGRTIASLAGEFSAARAAAKGSSRLTAVKDVADAFLAFMRLEYDEHYKSAVLPSQFREGPEFLLGGFGSQDKVPSLYRVKLKENIVQDEFAPGENGIAWNAQSDAVERIVRGYDINLKKEIEHLVQEAVQKYQDDMNASVLRIVDDVLKELNQTMPNGVDTALPTMPSLTMPWGEARLRIPYSALPMQEAVNFVSYLIFMQAGKSRFVRGVATVGGRTHVGVITKDKGFRQLNEPELTHRFTGFADDH